MSFDVFLAHNSEDKPAVRGLATRLRESGLTVWLDEDELQPGLHWQEGMEEGIRASGAGAVLIGKDGIGPWENEEMRVLLRFAVRRQIPVIPVLLPGAAAEPELPLFLDSRTRVDLRSGLTDDGLGRLIWGITGEKPAGSPSADTAEDSRPPLPVLFAKKDGGFADELIEQLGAVQRHFRVVPWPAGSQGLSERGRAQLLDLIDAAPVVVCLLSPDYLRCILHTDLSIPDRLERRRQSVDFPLLLLPTVVRIVPAGALRWLEPARWFPEDRTPIRSKSEDERDAVLAELVEYVDQKRGDPGFRMAPPEPAWPALPPGAVRIERLPRTAAGPLGRDAELEWLDELWNQEECSVVALVAAGGVGKTALVNRWVEEMQREHFRGAARVYAWSFYSQGTGERVTSADLFIDEALRWSGDREAATGDLSAWEKGHRLAAAIREERTLLILDGLEPLQGSIGFEKGEISGPALRTMLQDLAKSNPGLVVITTREPVAGVEGPEVVQENLEQVSREAVRALLRRADLRGTDEECDRVGEAFGFHALAIHLLVPYLHGCPGRRVTFALQIPDLEGVSEGDGKQPRRVMEFQAGQLEGTPELNLLHVLGLFDRIATGKEIAHLRSASTVEGLNDKLRFQTDREWELTVARLRTLNFVSPPSHCDYDVTGEIVVVKDLRRVGALDAHPLVRTHFGQRLREGNEAAWKEGHRILYRCLTSVTPRFPDTMQEMAPLYQAVAHGCQAGLHQEACVEIYRDRILRGQKANRATMFGAVGADLGAMTHFFEEPWKRVAPSLSEPAQAWLLSEAALRLRALGRLTEALDPMQGGAKMGAEAQDWGEAAIRTNNLSELELKLGEVAAAVRDAEQAVDFADRSGDAFQRMVNRATLSDSLHQAGRRAEALEQFQEAEAMQGKREPAHPLLYSLRGFQYCDLLLTGAEAAAWRSMVALSGSSETRPPAPSQRVGEEPGAETADPAQACREVELRAEKALKIAERNNWRLNIALDQLTLGRSWLYRAVLECSPHDICHESLDRAVDGLRASERQDYVPVGLLSRAWLRFLENDLEATHGDLDEAWDLAERGAMRLHMADVLLTRARLFHNRESLARAKKLIEECGYGRRAEELADAEAAATGWRE